MSLTQINKAGLDEIALDHVFTIGASGSSAYTFQGEGLNGTVNNPTLYLTRGKTYRFENGSGGHPIRIQSTSGASGTAYNTGVTNNAGSGTVIVEVQHDAPDVLYYQCTSHAAMNGILYITGALADGGVTTAKIADSAVTTAKIADSAVTTAKIADNNVTEAKLALNAVTNNRVANGSITNAKIGNGAIDTAKLADQAVTLAKLEHGTSSNDGKFLRANNGADPSFETVSIPAGTTINNNADNRVITGSGTANTLNGEAGLTFDGSQFTTSPTLIGSGNISKTQDGVVIQRNSSSGSAEIVAGRSGGNYGQMQYFVAGASGVTKRHQIDYQSNFLWYDEDGSTEMMRLQHNNRLGIGTTSPTHKFQVADGTTAIGFSRDANNPQVVFDSNNLSSAAIIQAYESSGGGGFQFFTKDTGGTLRERLRITNAGGITFNGDSGQTQALDDYEEGTWTPSYRYGANITITNNRNGEYIRIGNLVYFRGYIQNQSVTGGQSWQADIAGLPFTPNSGGYGIYACSCYGTNWSYNSGYYGLVAMVNESHASVFLRANNSQGHNFAPTAYNMTNTTATYIAGCYHTLGY